MDDFLSIILQCINHFYNQIFLLGPFIFMCERYLKIPLKKYPNIRFLYRRRGDIIKRE